MEEIERTIRLPRDADRLQSYARHYAFRSPQTVEAVYVIPYVPTDWRQDVAAIIKAGYPPSTPAEIKDMKAMNALSREQWGDAGKRYWHRSRNVFPMIDDGGCAQISIVYDINAKRILSLDCNFDLLQGRFTGH